MCIRDSIKAVQVLAKEKTGALIVLERETKLGDVIETGIKMDALVSGELLVNTFIPNTPLHDGAMIIREDRIMASGCFLPLTENQNLSKQPVSYTHLDVYKRQDGKDGGKKKDYFQRHSAVWLLYPGELSGSPQELGSPTGGI